MLVFPDFKVPFILTTDASTVGLGAVLSLVQKGTERPVSFANRQLNPLNAELNPICYLLALLGAHHFLHVSRIRVKSLTLRLLMSYMYMYVCMYIYMCVCVCVCVCIYIYIYIWSTYS